MTDRDQNRDHHNGSWVQSLWWILFFICILYWSAPVYSAFGKILSANPDVGKLSKDAIVVYTAQLADIYPLVVGFLAAGAVSAAFSTVSWNYG